MERIKSLNLYQKGVLLLLTVMFLIFTVIYSVTVHREGFAYKNTILIPKQENGITVYSGKIQGEQAAFTVIENKTVEFQYGDKIYGPYVVKEDPSALPKQNELSDSMIGVEIYDNNEVIFRGGVLEEGEDRWLFNEDGSFDTTSVSYTINGVELDEDGNTIDQMEPPVFVIFELLSGPRISHKGDWLSWFVGVIISVFTVISILFADELFRWNLAFQIRNVQQAEPSEWEIASRYIVWTVFTVMAMLFFIMGLQYVN